MYLSTSKLWVILILLILRLYFCSNCFFYRFLLSFELFFFVSLFKNHFHYRSSGLFRTVCSLASDRRTLFTSCSPPLVHLLLTCRVFYHVLPDELVTAPSGVVRFRIWQPKHGLGDQWAIDHLLILPPQQSDSLMADPAVSY